MTKRGLVRANRIREACEAKRMAVGFHLNFGAPALIEQVGTLAFDFVYLDAEHGRFDLHDIENCCRAAELRDLTVGARVPHNDAHLISQYLNAGVQLIVVPHVNSGAEAAAAVDACFMEPIGHRPSGPSRSNSYFSGAEDLAPVIAELNANVMLAVQIESAEAIANLDEILSVAGIAFFIVGKADLAQSLGYARLKGRSHHPEIDRIAAEIGQRIRAAGGQVREDILRFGRIGDFIMKGAAQYLAGKST